MDKVLTDNSIAAGINSYGLSKRQNFKKSFATSGIIFFIIFLSGCASKGPILGGPVDDIPPLILNTVPENLSLSVRSDIKVKFEFNERMNRSSVEKAIFISPVPESKPEYKWNGYKKLTLIFTDELTGDRTYVISIGSGAADEHKNKMGESFNLAFSTGNRIDNGTISGRIYGKYEIGKTLIFAYLMEESSNFSPDTLKPDYTTQLSNEGIFRFNYLSYGR